MADFEGATIDDIYKAFAYAETGSGNYPDDWIRTIAKGTGSSAYGPVQMTGGSKSMIQYQLNNLGKTGIKWNKEEIGFMNRYKEQAENFLKYGGHDMIPGKEMYGYGKKGTLQESDKKLYTQVAKKLMKFELDKSGVIYNLKISWRKKEDTEYFKKFDKELRRVLDAKDTASLFPDETLMENMLS